MIRSYQRYYFCHIYCRYCIQGQGLFDMEPVNMSSLGICWHGCLVLIIRLPTLAQGGCRCSQKLGWIVARHSLLSFVVSNGKTFCTCLKFPTQIEIIMPSLLLNQRRSFTSFSKMKFTSLVPFAFTLLVLAAIYSLFQGTHSVTHSRLGCCSGTRQTVDSQRHDDRLASSVSFRHDVFTSHSRQSYCCRLLLYFVK